VKPLTALLGIVMGSAVALAVCLGLTGVVFLLLPEYSARLAGEQAPLLHGLFWSWSLAGVSAASFVGELRQRSWRHVPHGALLILLALLGWLYWPA
jgi:hypothetical protein